jgi:hypothetical protein
MLADEGKRSCAALPRGSIYMKGSRKSFYERIWLLIHNKDLSARSSHTTCDEEESANHNREVGKKRPWHEV